jgi:hypothetical protein
VDVDGSDWDWDGSSNERKGEFVKPPIQVFANVSDRVVWHERMVTADGKHGFKRSEICSSRGDHEAGM